MIKTAFISVSNKKGIVDFAKELLRLGIRIISTGNTAKLLREHKLNVSLVSEITKFPEMLDGRVKSLHPNIFAGILADRENKSHVNELKKLKIYPIDIVVVNFYDFEGAVSKIMNPAENNKISRTSRTSRTSRITKIDMDGIIKEIDIGGSALVRAAAKNYKNVVVIVDSDDYDFLVAKLKANNKKKSDQLNYNDKLKLATKAFSYTARYDTTLNIFFNFLEKDNFPEVLNLTFKKIQDLRYGENPYQFAAFYSDIFKNKNCVSSSKQLQGKTLSFNNIIDVNAAFELVKEFKEPTASIIKHTNPSGVASAFTIDEAYNQAYKTDPRSAFGSIVALNRKCNLETAILMKNAFIEVIIAPEFEGGALDIFKSKKNLRLLVGNPQHLESADNYDFKRVGGGILVQNDYCPEINADNLKLVTVRKPNKDELREMVFAWKVNKHVKSNSIVLAKDLVTVGIGAGQMSRVDAVKLAVMKSEGKSKGSVMSSDAFFPFRDGIDEAAKAGVTAIIQPGGSIRDKEVIDAANEHKIAMVFTGIRLFRH